MPTAQHLLAKQILGMPFLGGASNTTFTANAAANRLAFSLILEEAKTLNEVSVNVSAVAGTMAAASQKCEIFSDNAGVPNASLGSTTTYSPDPPTANELRFSGLSVALSAGVQYWVVLSNTDGTPASNFPTYKYFAGMTNQWVAGNGTTRGWMKKQSTDSGATWATSALANCAAIRLGFSDGTYAGVPYNTVTSLATASSTFGKQECGTAYTLPANFPPIKVRGVASALTKTGTPTQPLQFRVYNGATLLGTTTGVPVASVITNNVVYDYFTTPITIMGGQTIRVMVSEQSNADTSTNRFAPFIIQFENDANTKTLVPWQAKRTVTADSTATPPVFTDTDTEVCLIWLILDTDGELVNNAMAARLVGAVR